MTARRLGRGHLAWSPDGRTVAFTADRGPEPDLHPRTTIWAVDVDAQGADEPREVLAPAGWANNPAWSPDGRWIAAIGILEAEPLDDVSPGLLVGPSRWLRRAARASPRTSTARSATGLDTDLNGWMVDGRPGPYWLGGDRIVATVSGPRPLAPVRLHLDARTGGRADAHPLVDGDLTTHDLACRRRPESSSWLGTDGGRAMELLTADGRPLGDRRRTNAPDPHDVRARRWQRPVPACRR